MLHLELNPDSFKINNVSVEFPISIEKLQGIIGNNYSTLKTKNNTLFTWNDLGVIAFAKDGKKIETLSLELEQEVYKFSPSQTFSGTFLFNNEDIIDYYHQHKEKHVKLFKGDTSGALVLNTISAWFDVREDKVKAIELSTYKPYDRTEGISKDKYAINKPDEELITFTDFGFKLSVIEELIYTQGLLTPKFDVHEFAKWYTQREIDLDEEGYEPIAEVTQYFKDFPVPKRLAPKLTEIYQDGGNDIYMNLIPFSSGEEDYWDIESIADAKHFPNLKKVTLCYAKDHIVEDFEKLGIEAEWL
ncbi:DUF6892 domain-containing protein [Zunongwangia sp. HRR-M8]|uniref:DUF6892 domain-containing protein n=1 Tax=Zunongwangia sp. HRR-M8 TaxID=3015170 RepID=UPI0022DDE02A|nr:hypothetical protein [Zunongwangia sp. HRR-M8]WBL21140.1 hypothetical protein PBT89_10385 [Zunongwangia sp. HRR-M8]